MWLADDATGVGRLVDLRKWWDVIINVGKKIGYYVNESKSWLIVRDPNELEYAKNIFSDTAIKYTIEGKRHLGAAIGSESFKSAYIKEKVRLWCNEITKLSEFAKTQPHAAFSAYVHGEQHRFTYFLRTIEDMEQYLQPLDEVISNLFLPALFGSTVTEQEKQLFALPIKNGGLAIENLAAKAANEYGISRKVNAPLIAIICMQSDDLPNVEENKNMVSGINQQKAEAMKVQVENVEKLLPSDTLRIVEQTSQPGASNWLSVLPLSEHGFVLNKREFRDAMCLRYNRDLKGLPSNCPCRQTFDVNHAMNCKKGGFVIIRHNDIRDFEANLLSKVCHDVETEPALQPITREHLPASTIQGDDARLDVRARGFGRKGQNAFFDVRVTNANAKSQSKINLQTVLKKHEREKKRSYNERVMNVEQGTFTPLIFTVYGGTGSECTAYHKNLADKISSKTGENYAKVITFMRYKLSFIVLKSALLCLRGSRTIKTKNITTVDNDFELNCHNVRL